MRELEDRQKFALMIMLSLLVAASLGLFIFLS